MKTALITGANTGIGEALTQKLLDNGWLVYPTYWEEDPGDPTWKGHANARPLQCDVTNQEQIAETARKVEAESGQLDLLWNNAGYAGKCGAIEEPDMDEYRRTFEVNFWGTLYMVIGMAELLKKAKGRIVNTGSASVYMNIPMGSAYPVSKCAVYSFSDHLRLEMASYDVEVTTLHPGGVATPMTDFEPKPGDSLWERLPDRLRAHYQKHFKDSASAIGDNFKFLTPQEFADQLFDKIVQARKFKPFYIIGPGVGALPWLHRLMPKQQVLNTWAKMFGNK